MSSARKGKSRRGILLCLSTHRLNFEPLEQRALLSATMQFYHQLIDPGTGAAVNPNDLGTGASISPYGSGSPGSALSPTKIRTAYGITGIAGDGTGQTIALVDAYQNPNMAADLASFDTYYGLPAPPSFQQLNQTGGTDLSSVPTDSTGGWEQEEALDVEWAHAIAPGANIILIVANSAFDTDLMQAVNTARNLPGVSVVSMSWGGSESSSDPSFNATFTTPAGHTGVTFFASTGDSGAPSGYPAYSPNVVGVGGTTLTLNGNNYLSESGWSGSGGGISLYESQPAYQQGLVIHNGSSVISANGKRTNPDVSFDANPSSGVAVLDSYNGGSTPWYQIGGTSLSSPCWAALVAIANQLRANQGYTPLDGVTQTLPKLYALPASDFHDPTSGKNGSRGYTAGTGYDLVTGLGTPIANLLVPALAAQPTPDLSIAITHVGNFHPGDLGDTYTITVSNIGSAATSGAVSVVDVLPTGLTATAMSGAGWSANPLTLTATRNDTLAAGASYPVLTVTVDVASSAAASVINSATVSGGGEKNTANDTASDPTTIGFLTVAGTTPSISGGSLTAGATSLSINFNSAALGAATAANYQLQSAGSDGLLGTADDTIISLGASFSGTTATLSFPPLLENVYRLTVKDTITDISGVKLDGDRNGTAGGNYVADFVVLPSGILLGNATSFSSGGSNPLSIAVGDFNGDGVLDLAVTNSPLSTGTTSVGIFLGDGKGGFTVGTAITSGLSSPYAVAAGDFNGDGKIDLAVANNGNGTIGIFLGNGSGGFSVGTPVTVGSQPISLAVGDFNGDGKADIIAANYADSTLSILLGDGLGGFSVSSQSSGGTNPRAAATADFNHDGKLDVAVANYTSANVDILLGDGNGGFTAQPAVSTGGSGPRSIAVGDFNGDGNPDIVVGNHDSNNVGILLSNGSGGLAAATVVASGGTNPRGVAVADFNGDGKADIIASNSGSSNVGILLGDGSGGFAAATTFGTGVANGTFGIAIGDFNGDGRPDVAATDSGASTSSDQVTTLLDFYGSAPVTLTTPNGFAFDIATNGFGPGEFIQGTNNAFDGYGRLMVGGSIFQPSSQTYTTADSGQTVATDAGSVAGLTVSRKITVPHTGGEDFARTVDSFTNPTGSDITTTVQIVGNLGSDATSAIFATSSGSTTLSPSDQWFGTTGGTGPALIHYLHGPAGLQPTSVSLTGDNVVWTYSLTVHAGQTVELGYFTIQAADTSQAITEANALTGTGGFLDTAALGLTPSDLAALANFQFGPQPLIVTPINWNQTGTAGMTLILAADGKLHLYQTGTTTDIVVPEPYANVSSITITGRDNIADALTVDYSGGNPVPVGGVSFNGGTGGGNSLIIAGNAGNDNATMTPSQITDNGSAAIDYSNVEIFEFALGTGIDILLIDHAALVLHHDNTISANTSVTVDGGTLDYNGHANPLTNLEVTGGGTVLGGNVSTTTATTVVSGTLTAGSINSDTLIIGTVPPVVAASASLASKGSQSSSAPSSAETVAGADSNSPSSATAKNISVTSKPQVFASIFANIPPTPADAAVSAISISPTASSVKKIAIAQPDAISQPMDPPSPIALDKIKSLSGTLSIAATKGTATKDEGSISELLKNAGIPHLLDAVSLDIAIVVQSKSSFDTDPRETAIVNRVTNSWRLEPSSTGDSMEAALQQLVSLTHRMAEPTHHALDAAFASLKSEFLVDL